MEQAEEIDMELTALVDIIKRYRLKPNRRNQNALIRKMDWIKQLILVYTD